MGLNNNMYPLLLEQAAEAAPTTIAEARLRGVAATTEEGKENIEM